MNNAEFLCMDPGKKKRARLRNLFDPIGKITWIKFIGLSFRWYPETRVRAKRAFLQSKKLPRTKITKYLKFHALALQYNYTRKLIERKNFHAAIVWNGLNSTRSVFSSAAKDAGIKTLYCELSPFKGKITVDPSGVNYNNCLPRYIDPYISWYKEQGKSDRLKRTKATITARKSISTIASQKASLSMENPYIFVPLQVHGDSQLRLFGRHFKSMPKLIEKLAEFACLLPEHWHIRIKEHPSETVRLRHEYITALPKQIVIDNYNDTFKQVSKSRLVLTVNSSVGLEAMFYNKPVVALGYAYWAFGNLAHSCRSVPELRMLLSNVEQLSFNAFEREAFLSFILERYFVEEAKPREQMLERIEGEQQFLNGVLKIRREQSLT